VASDFADPDSVRRTFFGLVIATVSPHSLELRHPNFELPVLELSFPYEDCLAQGSVRCAGYRQRLTFLPGQPQGKVEEDGAFEGDDEEDQDGWSCPWDSWVRQWCQALMHTPPRMVRPGKDSA
jgi:hypothetical protein